MKKFIPIFTVMLAVICCLCLFTACNDIQKYQNGTHFEGDCQNKGYTRYLLPNGKYYDVPDEDFGAHDYHVFTEIEATCVSEGKDKYTCSICGHSYYETTRNGEHDYIMSAYVPATCSTNGNADFTCSLCSDSYSVEIEKTDHTPGIYVPNGDEHKILCKYGCDTELGTEKHTYDKVETLIEATCSNKGSEKHICTKCGDFYTEETDITDHDYTDSVITQPTCLTEGQIKHSCKHCTHSYTEPSPTVEHEPSETLGYDENGHWTVCKYGCGTQLQTFEHNLTSKFVQAVCYEQSYTLYECSDCDYSYKIIDENSELSSHVYEAYTCIYCERDMLLDHIEEFGNHGDSQTDLIEIDNEFEMCCFMDYITVYNVTNQKHFKLTYVTLTEDNYSEFISNALQRSRTATNWGYTLGRYSSNNEIVSLYIYTKTDDNEFALDKIATVTPYTGEYQNVVYPQIDSYQFEKAATRPQDFDDFAYKNRRYEMEVSTSDQLFYAFEHGYKPIAVSGSRAEDMLALAKEVSRQIIDDNMSDLEKVRAIFMWLVSEIQYDYGALNNQALHWRHCSSYYIEGVFQYKIAVCDGISKAFCVLAGIEDIKCIRITGADHAWNKVWIDIDGDGTKEWYCTDATWGNRRITLGSGDGAVDKEMLSISDFLFTDEQKIANGKTGLNYANTGCEAVTEVNPYSQIYFGNEHDASTDYVISDSTEMLELFAYIKGACDGRENTVTFEMFVTVDYCESSTAILEEIKVAYNTSNLSYGIMRSISQNTTAYGQAEGYTVIVFIVIE